MEINKENLENIGFKQMKSVPTLFVMTSPDDETIVFSVALNQGHPILNVYIDNFVNHHNVNAVELVDYWVNSYLQYR